MRFSGAAAKRGFEAALLALLAACAGGRRAQPLVPESDRSAAGAPEWKWADRFGSRGRNVGRAVAIAAGGEVYSIGELAGSSAAGERSWAGDVQRGPMFLARHAPDGHRDWLLRFGGSPADEPRAVAVGADGTVLVAGLFSGELGFGEASGIPPLHSIGGADAFLVDVAPDATPRWAVRWGGKRADAARALAVDEAGNLYVAGTFQLTVDFDAAAGRTLMTSAGGRDVFVLKLDPARRLLWARRLGGTGAEDVTGLAVGTDGNVYVGGGLEGRTWEGDERKAPAAGRDGGLFLAALAPDGSGRWVRRLDADGGASLAGLATDARGAVYAAGGFQGGLRFEGREVLANPAGWDVFVARLQPSGALVWARDVGAETEPSLTAGGLAATAAGLLVGGSFQGRVDFGPPVRRALHAESRAPFLAAFDAGGSLTGVGSPTTSGLAQVLAVAAGAGGRAVVLGVGEPRRGGEDGAAGDDSEGGSEGEGENRELVLLGFTMAADSDGRGEIEKPPLRRVIPGPRSPRPTAR